MSGSDLSTAFAGVDTWVFDLDNTLYPPSAGIFEQVTERMTGWVVANLQMSRDSALLLRRSYRSRFGTTLAGLISEHGIDPSAFLAHVHKIDISALGPDPALAAALAALPGRRIVHTNADAAYARRILTARGIEKQFHMVYAIEDTGFRPKPSADAYDRVRAKDGFEPSRAVMFEDEARNLEIPHARGMRTVQIAAQRDAGAHVQHWGADLTAFLTALAGAPG